MIVVSLAFVIYAAGKKILGWKHLGMGALFWVLTVAAKFIFAIPVNPLLFRLLGVSYENLFSPANLVYYLYIGALTGIFEGGLAWLILSKTRWGKADWNQALVFGIGFGVIEAFLLGITDMASALVGIFSPDVLPVSALGGLASNATLSMALAPIVERLFVILAHIFTCVLIFHAINSKEAKWGWLAILYKTLLDTPAGFAAFWGVGTAAKLWTIEGTIIICGLIGLWGTIQIARRYAERSVQTLTVDAPN
ncbi:MAG: YhfC family glutamic-type intramembrane protease [Anaerolineales bacterium]